MYVYLSIKSQSFNDTCIIVNLVFDISINDQFEVEKEKDKKIFTQLWACLCRPIRYRLTIDLSYNRPIELLGSVESA